MAVPPIVDPGVLAAYLKGTPDPELVALCAAAASETVAALVDPPPPDADDSYVWPSGVTLAGLGIASDAFKTLSAQGSGYALDEYSYTDTFVVTSSIARKYEPFYNPARAVGGMVG
jgi:hypothetical protein